MNFVLKKTEKLKLKRNKMTFQIFRNSNFALQNICSHCIHAQCNYHRMKCRKA